jgi:hypothetical protein
MSIIVDKETLTYSEVLQYSAKLPIYSHPVRGRQLFALELFAGTGAVTQAFSQLKWTVRSHDIDPKSYATDFVDIMNITFQNIGAVPDFIWASLECKTYSQLAGSAHRAVSEGIYELSPEAVYHNKMLTKLVYILRWAKKHNPHLIIAIENPKGLLAKMPLMHEAEEVLGLEPVDVDYCRWGRTEKKSTMIWTNSSALRGEIGRTCTKATCKYFKVPHRKYILVQRTHPVIFCLLPC